MSVKELVRKDSVELEKPDQTNDLGYEVIDAKSLSPISDFILVTWDFCQSNIKVGQFVLSRPDTHIKQHYVGTVIALGPEVDDAIKIGDRLVFDQFSNFEKFWDEEYGRIALLQESKQGSLFAIVPKRIKVEGSEGDYNFEI